MGECSADVPRFIDIGYVYTGCRITSYKIDIIYVYC
jgi:hypothetical protein